MYKPEQEAIHRSFRAECEQCANEELHHHTGEQTQGMPHEALNYYCWCLDVQKPTDG